MTIKTEKFWKLFREGCLEEALEHFALLEKDSQIEVFEALFQNGSNALKPFMISVLRRQLKEGQSFTDFYTHWSPPEASCKPTIVGGQVLKWCCGMHTSQVIT